MNILALDTATPLCSAAIMKDNEIIERFEVAPQRHAELILPMVAELLAKTGIKHSELNAIAFGQGPGSFIGVRIAASVAQGLAYTAVCPAVGISTLQALAQTAYMQHGYQEVIVGLDARMAEIYWGAYKLDANSDIMQPIQAECLDKPELVDLARLGKKYTKPVAVGNAWDVYEVNMGQVEPKLEPMIYPRAAAVARLASLRLAKGDAGSAAVAARPVYLRNKVAKKSSKFKKQGD